jgi:hypothetical protein
MSDDQGAVPRGQLCSKCPDILVGIEGIKATSNGIDRRLTELRETQDAIFHKIDAIKDTTAKHETALAVLASKVKEDADSAAQKKADRAENRATWKSAGLLVGGTALWEVLKHKMGW